MVTMNHSKKTFDMLVCGGGFRGMLVAERLASTGKKVALIESSPRLGGVLNSIPWEGYHLDIGCHLFDNSTAELTQLFFAIHDDFHPVEVTYHSVMANDAIADNMASPDLTLMGAQADKVKLSLESVEAEQQLANNYEQYLQARFGEYNAEFLTDCVAKKTGVAAKDLCHTAANVVLMNRVKLLPDHESKSLKEHSFYDERLAVPSASKPMMHYEAAVKAYPFRNFYPAKKGMGAFVESMQSRLQQLGVNIVTAEKVVEIDAGGMVKTDQSNYFSANSVIWSGELAFLEQVLFQRSTLLDAMQPVAVVLAYFEVPVSAVSDVTYLHDYRKDSACYRISTAGKYSKQIIDDKTYICCEVFTQPGEKLWNISEDDYQSVWQQAVELGVVDCTTPLSVKVLKNSAAYRLPLVGYAQAAEQLSKDLQHQFSDIITFGAPSFSKHKIYSEVSAMVEKLL